MEKLIDDTNRMSMKCPVCGGENSCMEGGNDRCFHCGDCGFFECMFHTEKEVLEYIEQLSNSIKRFYNIDT